MSKYVEMRGFGEAAGIESTIADDTLWLMGPKVLEYHTQMRSKSLRHIMYAAWVPAALVGNDAPGLVRAFAVYTSHGVNHYSYAPVPLDEGARRLLSAGAFLHLWGDDS